MKSVHMESQIGYIRSISRFHKDSLLGQWRFWPENLEKMMSGRAAGFRLPDRAVDALSGRASRVLQRYRLPSETRRRYGHPAGAAHRRRQPRNAEKHQAVQRRRRQLLVHLPVQLSCEMKRKRSVKSSQTFFRARNEIRTRDPRLGKAMLYH